MPRATSSDPLQRYAAKRNFGVTSEPKGVRAKSGQALSFVIQKHWATRLHYDFRLELDGVLLSWAVPKGPSYDPKKKRMAIHVEDHPVSYGSFEGTIPPKQYGAGKVIVWDNGTWEPVGHPRQGLDQGKLVFRLHGQKLAGLWELVRTSKPSDKQDQWLLFKKRYEWAQAEAEFDVVAALPDSVIEEPLGPIESRVPKPAGPAAVASGEPDLSAAKKASLPEKLSPQLATLASAPPAAGAWICENKFDGYRVLARIERGKVRLVTRNGHDWTRKLQSLADEIAALGIDTAWLDGEIVVLDSKGVPNFNALQNAMDASKSAGVTYFAFDAPFFGPYDLRAVPLASRRVVLARAFEGLKSERVRFSAAFDVAPSQLLDAACRMNLEGVMLKRADAPYVSARTDTWLKLKCSQRQEFVVCGFTDRKGTPGEVGSLLLGYHEDGTLRYAGNVGTGWDHETGREMYQTLSKLEVERPPFDPKSAKPGRWSKRSAGGEHWTQPSLVAEVSFTEWTPDGHVRHPSFKGWRTDKPAHAIGRERSMTPPQMATRARAAGTIKITNPDRVIDPSTGLKKLDLVHYYDSVAERMLPHLKGRPVSLVRAPDGIKGQLFFQKHPETKMPGLKELDPALWPGHTALLAGGPHRLPRKRTSQESRGRGRPAPVRRNHRARAAQSAGPAQDIAAVAECAGRSGRKRRAGPEDHGAAASLPRAPRRRPGGPDAPTRRSVGASFASSHESGRRPVPRFRHGADWSLGQCNDLQRPADGRVQASGNRRPDLRRHRQQGHMHVAASVVGADESQRFAGAHRVASLRELVHQVFTGHDGHTPT